MLDETTILETIDGNMRRNAELLDVLREKGIALDVSRKIEFHYWAWSESDAAKLKEALIQAEVVVKEVAAIKGENENLWSATAEVKTTPALAASLEQTRTNVMLAAKFDCIYDGWGTRI
jgi:regulator of RNase E activity RraB